VGGAAPSYGSGLPGMRDRVAAHGGTLLVESPPGAGTRIEVVLPCAS
jgi:signal transduction histidine kinase